jgi:hypothetical protein
LDVIQWATCREFSTRIVRIWLRGLSLDTCIICRSLVLGKNKKA